MLGLVNVIVYHGDSNSMYKSNQWPHCMWSQHEDNIHKYTKTLIKTLKWGQYMLQQKEDHKHLENWWTKCIK